MRRPDPRYEASGRNVCEDDAVNRLEARKDYGPVLGITRSAERPSFKIQ